MTNEHVLLRLKDITKNQFDENGVYISLVKLCASAAEIIETQAARIAELEKERDEAMARGVQNNAAKTVHNNLRSA